jgi:hypothetical protein
MYENSIGLKQVLEGLLKETLSQRYYCKFSNGVTFCHTGSGRESNQRAFKQIGFLDITGS